MFFFVQFHSFSVRVLRSHHLPRKMRGVNCGPRKYSLIFKKMIISLEQKAYMCVEQLGKDTRTIHNGRFDGMCFMAMI